jgi:hypothetical protein
VQAKANGVVTATAAQVATSARTTSAAASPKPPRAAYYWTWQLMQDGYRLADVSEIRGLSMEVVRHHLQTARAEGCPVESAWLEESY